MDHLLQTLFVKFALCVKFAQPSLVVQKKKKKSSQQFEPTFSCKTIGMLGNKSASSYYAKLMNDKKSNNQ
jgi:hypothetical protein